jgi:hypothetical protein
MVDGESCMGHITWSGFQDLRSMTWEKVLLDLLQSPKGRSRRYCFSYLSSLEQDFDVLTFRYAEKQLEITYLP